MPYVDLLEEILSLIAEDAAALDCEAEVLHTRQIARHGTSADRQLAIYASAIATGASTEAALTSVVDHLVAETIAGL